MNLREEILNTFADGLETIVQVHGYLKYLKIAANEQQILDELSLLLQEKKIEIVYLPEMTSHKVLNVSILADYWFEMTPSGREEWDKIIVEDE